MRKRTLQAVLVLVGLLFTAAVYPMVVFFQTEAALAMMLSVYATLGIFLLLAAWNPAAHRSLIAFAAWSSFAHAAVMGSQAYRHYIAHGEMIGVWGLLVIGITLITLAPAE
jgi:hypothetical protein